MSASILSDRLADSDHRDTPTTTDACVSQTAMLSRPAPAKINLFLHITGKRSDGYHELQTVFRLLDWGDTLHFFYPRGGREISTALMVRANDLTDRLSHEIVDSGLIQLSNAETMTTAPTDNLIIKASSALIRYALQNDQLPDTLPQLNIAVDKIIPMGAGLGGGSSNAATTLMALNELWRLNLSVEQLLEIAATVGADVPIFILHQDAIGEGIGEKLTPIALPAQRYLLLFPNAHISTAKLFSHPNLGRDCPSLSIEQITEDQHHYLWALDMPYHNVFETVVSELSFEVRDALAYLCQLAFQWSSNGLAKPPSAPLSSIDMSVMKAIPPAPLSPRMTGSGSTVFLPLPEQIPEQMLQVWLTHAPCPARIVNSLYDQDGNQESDQ